jgi:hypothetical protein
LISTFHCVKDNKYSENIYTVCIVDYDYEFIFIWT